MKKLYLVGLGPGSAEQMTLQAYHALEEADVLCGYTAYVDLVRPLFPEKETYTTPMTQELARCRWAIDTAGRGKTVALLCSGDAGVYGMAGPILQLLGEREDIDVQVIPGVTAALSGAALLGAPLMHDFCVISLSDLLTPWEQIEQRITAAAVGDFSIVLYNPGSHRRKEHLKRAVSLLLQHKSPHTVCGLAQNIGRPGESCRLLTLQELQNTPVDMFTTVFVGAGTTQSIHGRMVTPRGYENKA